MMESKTTEFKQVYTDNIKYAIIAFANTDGGKIFVGLNDDGSVRGVDHPDDTMLRLTNMARDSIHPDVTMFMDCTTQIMEGKPVVVLTVQRGTARPYYLAGKGVRPEGVYVRQGASSVPASETAILQMIRETSGDRYEDARSINQQLTFQKTSAYFARKKLPFGEAQQRTLGVVGADGTYTNLGMLLSEQCVPTIKLAVFDGSQKTVFRDRKELTGSLLGQLEEAYHYLDQFNRTRAEFDELERIDRRDYPPEALREALLNAIVHRDYAINGPTLISIFDDRIEIVTIGGLVRGICFEDIMLGVSVLRNQHLANVFYRLNLIEAYGTGMLKINECYADIDRKPQIEVTANAFKMTLPNVNYGRSSVSTRLDKPRANVRKDQGETVLALFDRQDTITRRDVETLLDVSQGTAVLILRRLLDDGSIIKEGGGKSVCYRLA